VKTFNLPALQDELDALDRAIADLKEQDILQGYRVKTIKPGGTAGNPAKKKGYARLINPDGGSRAIASSTVPEYREQIERGRELKRIQRQRTALVVRIDKAIAKA
jgi:hypothetical protein